MKPKLEQEAAEVAENSISVSPASSCSNAFGSARSQLRNSELLPDQTEMAEAERKSRFLLLCSLCFLLFK
jgi:hypothetical protein